MSFFIDTHCHLDLFPDIINKATLEDELGIKTISVTNAPTFFNANSILFNSSKNIRVALGLHPQLVKTHFNEIDIFQANLMKTKYVGEIGLDGSEEFKDTYNQQKKVFEAILGLTRKEHNKLLTIHSRKAATETIGSLEKMGIANNNKVILHWFSGNKYEARTAIKNGYYFSINHKMANSQKGQEIIKAIPDELLLTETDAPFTFSAGIKTRMQSLLYTIKAIAKVKDKSEEDVKEFICKNFKSILSETKK